MSKDKIKKKNKRAELGEAITWVVATIIIFVVLAIFIFAANAMGTWKSLQVSSGEIKTDLDATINTKTELAFEKNYANQKKIEAWINGAKKYK